MPVKIRVRFGDPSGVADVEAQIRAQVVARASDEVIKRVQKRLKSNGHPTSSAIAAGLRSESTNQWSATITSTRGGPGPIRPRFKKALSWPAARHPVAFVQGKGIGPLIEAEAKRVTNIDTNGIEIR